MEGKVDAVVRVEAAENEESVADGVDSENDGNGGMLAEAREDVVGEGAVDGRLFAVLSRVEVRRLLSLTIWLTNSGRRGDGAVEDDDSELSDCASLSAGERGTGQCGRSRMHSGDTRMDSGRLVRANSSETSDSASTSTSTAA